MGILTDFEASPLSGNDPLTVQFLDKTAGGADYWFWDFGDGNFSIDENPVHNYMSPGVYSVTLTAGVVDVIGEVGPSPGSHWRKQTLWMGTEALAWSAYQGLPWTETGSYGHFVFHEVRNFEHPVTHADQWTYTSWKSAGPLFNLEGYGGYHLAFLKLFGHCYNQLSPGLDWNMACNLAAIPPPPIDPVLALNFSLLVKNMTYALGTKPYLELYDTGYARIGLGQARITAQAQIGYMIIGAAAPQPGSRIVVVRFTEYDTLTKPDYITVIPGYCGVGWIMVSYEVLPDPILGNLLVVSTTDKCHLWLDYMLDFPDKSLKWRTKYGMKYRCSPHYDLSINGTIEQTELGDTIEHTFILAVVPPVEDIAVIVYGQQCGVDVASKSPLIRIDNT